MNVKQQGIVTLIKSAVTGERFALPEGFDLEEASRLIRAHQIGALIYEGALQCGVTQNSPAMQRLFQYYCKSAQISKRQMQKLEQVFTAFEANGIDYMPVKGCVLKSLYRKPEHRMMGDADVLIRMSQYEKIVPIMQELGFEPGGEAEHHFVWKADALTIELHKSLFKENDSQYTAHFGDGWPLAHRQAGNRYALKPEDAYIHVFAHFANHFRHAGVGCRQLVDLWVLFNAYPELDGAYIQRILEQMRLETFHRNTRRTISVWFEGAEEDDVTRLMTDVIFANGSWGSAQQGTISAGISDMQRSPRAFSARLLYVFRHIFPGVENLRRRYPILQKAPYLLPVAWVYYLISRTFFAEGVLKRQVRNLSALTKENVETRQRMLESVGFRDW